MSKKGTTTKRFFRAFVFAVLAVAGLMSSANAATIPFTISGNLGSDSIIGSGQGVLGSEFISNYSFAVSGTDPMWTSYVGSYQPLAGLGGETYQVWSDNPNPPSGWTPEPACPLGGGCGGTVPGILFIAVNGSGGVGPNFIPGTDIAFNVGTGADFIGGGGGAYMDPGSSVIFAVSAVPLPPAL